MMINAIALSGSCGVTYIQISYTRVYPKVSGLSRF